MRITERVYKILSTFLLLTSSINLVAQQSFKYKADIGQVDTAAFYRVVLSPGVLAKSSTELADIRLLAQNGKFVPFMFGNRLPENVQHHTTMFREIMLPADQDTVTTFIAENNQRLTINHLNLIMRNTAVDRIVNLTGSDDLKNWYAIKEDIKLRKAGEANKNGSYSQLLNFPASTYRYLKIQVNNNRKAPVSILGAGVYETETIKPVYVKLTGLKFTQKDTGKISHVIISFNEAYPINQLKLSIAGAKYYKRDINVYSVRGKSRVLLANTSISSIDANRLNIAAKTKAIQLDIFNEDNPPLKISDVLAYELEQSLVAYLYKGVKYSLLLGDTAAKAPIYDLRFFADSVQRHISQVPVGNIGNNPIYQHKIETAKPQLPLWLMWGAIVVVLALLSILTLRMTKKVSSRV